MKKTLVMIPENLDRTRIEQLFDYHNDELTEALENIAKAFADLANGLHANPDKFMNAIREWKLARQSINNAGIGIALGMGEFVQILFLITGDVNRDAGQFNAYTKNSLEYIPDDETEN